MCLLQWKVTVFCKMFPVSNFMLQSIGLLTNLSSVLRLQHRFMEYIFINQSYSISICL